MDITLTVTYYHHAGFSVTDGNILLIFDYWRGENGEMAACPLTASELTGYKRVYVFVSNDREDHFDDVVFTWDKTASNITYIIAGNMEGECRRKARGLEMNEGDDLKLEGVDIHAYGTSDRGVSFLVTLDELNIFYAGELNLWHWREESSLREIAQAERDFYDAMRPIERLPIDIAMFPVDPRMGGLYDAGANYFVMAAKPRLFIPMHWQGRAEVAASFARKGKTRYTEVLALTKPRERAELEFEPNELHIHVFTVLPPVKKLRDDDAVFDANDPFNDTDLPVKLD